MKVYNYLSGYLYSDLVEHLGDDSVLLLLVPAENYGFSRRGIYYAIYHGRGWKWGGGGEK